MLSCQDYIGSRLYSTAVLQMQKLRLLEIDLCKAMFFTEALWGSRLFNSSWMFFLTVLHLALIWWENREANPKILIEDPHWQERRSRGIVDSGAGMTQAVLKELEHSKSFLDVVDRFCNFKQMTYHEPIFTIG